MTSLPPGYEIFPPDDIFPIAGIPAMMDYANAGNFGVGVTPTQSLQVAGNIRIPNTTATTGIIMQDSKRLIHTTGSDDFMTTYNLFVGTYAGNLTTTAVSNVGIGPFALYAITTGTANNAFGGGALRGLTTGSHNTAVGHTALMTSTDGTYNTAVGSVAMSLVTSGSENTAVGANSGNLLTTGLYNVMIGTSSLPQCTTGAGNTAVGYRAGYTGRTSQAGSVFLGHQAGYYETADNKLFIDDAPRASQADARLKALIYGVFDAAVANQRLTFNAGWMGFFGTVAIAQPTTGGAAGVFVVNAGVAVNDASTFDGYTLPQLVRAIRLLGLLA